MTLRNSREICATVGPYLRERGVLFAGIDVLGDYLTEINVTSPTGMREVNALEGLTGDATMQAKFWDGVEARKAVLGLVLDPLGRQRAPDASPFRARGSAGLVRWLLFECQLG